MRLHEMSEREMVQWQEARMKAGQEKYHGIDHRRDLLIDVVEEALDIKNILQRFYDHHRPIITKEMWDYMNKIMDAATEVIDCSVDLDKLVPRVDDTYGGERVWITEQAKTDVPDSCLSCDALKSCEEECLLEKREEMIKECGEMIDKCEEMVEECINRLQEIVQVSGLIETARRDR